ncbi:MAG: type II toxin-antitoxin system HicB family antitoxin [Candidatus Hydrogenedentota bacterium]
MSYNLDLTIVFERDDDGSVLARCIKLGTASCGATREEALGNVQEAIDEHATALVEEGLLEKTLSERGYGIRTWYRN